MPSRRLVRGNCFAIILVSIFTILAAASGVSLAAGVVTFEAESGALGSNWAVSNSASPEYITVLSDGAGNNPSNATRVASYTVTFPSADTYQLYARVRVGPGTFNDDSLFFAASFGSKSVTLNSDWVLVNGLAAVGFSNSTDVVTGGGTLGSGMWKWINLSQFTSQAGFIVAAGNLTQTFQIGARENGLDLDAFAFGSAGTAFTVSNLDTGTIPGSGINTNVFIGPNGIAFHRFSALADGLNQDGANPAGGLVLSGNVLCGTTLNGGLEGAGTAFWMTPDGTNFNAFRSFSDIPDAANPEGGLAVSGNVFFGTSFGGGSNGAGAVFVGQTNGNVSVVRSFEAVDEDEATNIGGASPSALLALSSGAVYGTTTAGGIVGSGTVFSFTTNGNSFSVLHDFSTLNSVTGTNLDGATPWGGLVLSGDTLYGTASAGGDGGGGVVFSVDTNGGNFTVLHSFTPMDVLTRTNADGAMPLGGLALSGNTLYGTTVAGGDGGRGTIFSIQTTGLAFGVIRHFAPVDSVTGTNADGASPCAALTVASNTLYGTASAGGAGAAGTVFSVNINGGQFNRLHSFSAVASNGTNADGAFPIAPLLQLGNSLYGTTFSGGPGAVGTVFSILVPPPPAIITNVVRNLDGSVTLFFLGAPSSTNIIQTTTNLTAPILWQNVSTNVADVNGAWQFTDGSSTTTRFYRSYTF